MTEQGTTSPAPADPPLCVYVYAITASRTAVPMGCGGVGDENAVVYVLRRDGLAAVVSPLAGRPRAGRRDLRAHQDVLAALAARGAVLPMRFGVVAPDERAVLADLEAARDSYLAALERVEGKDEWNVKGTPVPGPPREEALPRTPHGTVRRRPGYGADVRPGAAVMPDPRHRIERAAAEVVAELSPLASEFRTGRSLVDCALNASFLVPRTGAGAFRAAVDRLTARYAGRIDLTLTGPLPCYRFVAAEPVPTGP